MSKPTFYRLEYYQKRYLEHHVLSVICSFKTERFGYLQVKLKQLETGWKFSSLPQEPDLNMLSAGDLHHIEIVSRIVWRMVYDAPPKTERFA